VRRKRRGRTESVFHRAPYVLAASRHRAVGCNYRQIYCFPTSCALIMESVNNLARPVALGVIQTGERDVGSCKCLFGRPEIMVRILMCSTSSSKANRINNDLARVEQDGRKMKKRSLNRSAMIDFSRFLLSCTVAM
jgi:hypothetical protein